MSIENKNPNEDTENIHSKFFETEPDDNKKLRDFTKKYSSVERDELVSDIKNVTREERKHEIEEFYKKQEAILEEFEGSIDQRNIKDIIKEKQVLFTHGIPFDEYWGEADRKQKVMKNTLGNNNVINPRKLNYENLVKIVIGLQPTISTCVNKVSETDPRSHYYPSGLLIGGGRAMIVNQQDMFTVASNLYSRGLKKGRRELASEDMVTHSIQNNIPQKIEKTVSISDSNSRLGAKNEVVIEDPETLGFYVDYNRYQGDKDYLLEEEKEYLRQVKELSKKFNLPFFVLIDGKIREIAIDENGKAIEGKEVTIEEMLAENRDISINDKLHYINDIIEEGIFPEDEIPKAVEDRIKNDHP